MAHFNHTHTIRVIVAMLIKQFWLMDINVSQETLKIDNTISIKKTITK